MMRRTYSLLLCTAAALLQARSQATDSQAPISLHDPSARTALVARVGSIGITAQEFLLNYEYAPAFIKVRKDAKRRLLDLMINEKLFALEGGGKGAEAHIASTLEEVEGDLATEELYKREILPRVRVKAVDLARGIREAGIHMQVQWLFAAEPAARDGLAASLRGGADFDRLFAAQNPDSSARINRTMEGTLFDIRKRNGSIAAVLESLPPGSISPAVRGHDGWYIVRIRDEWRDALQTETEQQKIRHDVEEALTQQKADSLADRYVVRLMTDSRPVIVKETFGLLLGFFAQYYADSAVAASWGYLPPAGTHANWAPRDTRWVEALGGQPLVTLRGGRDTLRLGSFLSWYRNRETLLKIPARRQDEFFYEAQQLVWHMVRDRLLVEQARRKKLNSLPAVQVQRKWWEEKLLFNVAKSSITNSIPWRDEDLRAFYREHRREFRDAKGDTLGFEAARDDVLRSYYRLETAKRMFHQVARLRRKYPIEVHGATLARIPAEENQAKPIDVYVVKKGGTFPRPAFPTVDPGWKEWY